MFKILWPETRFVTASKIEGWYEDAVANGEVDALDGLATTEEKATALHRSGLITLGRK